MEPACRLTFPAPDDDEGDDDDHGIWIELVPASMIVPVSAVAEPSRRSKNDTSLRVLGRLSPPSKACASEDAL
jgi:hypothetical protein